MRIFALAIALLAFSTPSFARSHAGAHRRHSNTTQVYKECKTPGHFALTFDDGPWEYEPKVVQDLEGKGVLGTFFVNGDNYACIYDYADQLQSIFDAGHIIGSHTWTHRDINEVSPEELESEMGKIEVALKKILGIRPKLFRPPYGQYNDTNVRILKQRGYSTIDWSLDAGDALGETPEYSKAQYDAQAALFPAPGVSLMHETINTTAYEVLPYAIEVLQAAGYQLVTLPVCLGLKPYDYITGKETRNESWKC